MKTVSAVSKFNISALRFAVGVVAIVFAVAVSAVTAVNVNNDVAGSIASQSR